jgi:hypothetical protein
MTIVSPKQVFSFYLQNARPAPITDLRAVVDRFVGFEATQEHQAKHRDFYSSLTQEQVWYGGSADESILKVLFEEWVFLQENSWIISRIKKPFDKFIEAGAVSLQVGGTTVKRMVAKTLKHKEDYVFSRLDYLRALAKWVAVGGSTVVPLFNPIAGALVNAASGYFLLLDP